MRAAPFAVLAALALAACVDEAPPDGHSLFAENCASCHGADAKGGGELAAGLPVAPPDLTTISARHRGVFPRDYVMSTIDGYSRGLHGAQVMPEFGDGNLGPTVIIEDGEGNGIPVPVNLLALAQYIESIQAP
ncbi:MAG: cytochrome c [Rubellimicrobium sp.]|nr:cytochrome c [Rubellimicrobium sp.]